MTVSFLLPSGEGGAKRRMRVGDRPALKLAEL
jgi:hypothetical protein